MFILNLFVQVLIRKPLKLSDLFNLMLAPTVINDDLSVSALTYFAKSLSSTAFEICSELDLLSKGTAQLSDEEGIYQKRMSNNLRKEPRVPELPYIAMAKVRIPRTQGDLKQIESAYNVFDISLWLSYRYNYTDQEREKLHREREICGRLIRKGISDLRFGL